MVVVRTSSYIRNVNALILVLAIAISRHLEGVNSVKGLVIFVSLALYNAARRSCIAKSLRLPFPQEKKKLSI